MPSARAHLETEESSRGLAVRLPSSQVPAASAPDSAVEMDRSAMDTTADNEPMVE